MGAGQVASRLSRLASLIAERRTPGDYVRVADMRHADEIVRQAGAVLAGDWLASDRLYVLLTPSGNHAVTLAWIARCEDQEGVTDSAFWAAVGGRPGLYQPRDVCAAGQPDLTAALTDGPSPWLTGGHGSGLRHAHASTNENDS